MNLSQFLLALGARKKAFLLILITVIVAAISGSRGPAPVARTLYFETDESIARRENDKEARRLYPEPSMDIKGRPTKRDRRALTKAGSE